jgi:hypothetical protein
MLKDDEDLDVRFYAEETAAALETFFTGVGK